MKNLIFLIIFLFMSLTPYKIYAETINPETDIQEEYDASNYQQALETLKENIQNIEGKKGGRPSNSERAILSPNQSLRKIQEEVPNHERIIDNRSRPINQRSIPNDATRQSNQKSLLIK